MLQDTCVSHRPLMWISFRMADFAQSVRQERAPEERVLYRILDWAEYRGAKSRRSYRSLFS